MILLFFLTACAQPPSQKWAVLISDNTPTPRLPHRWLNRAHGLLEVTGSFEQVRSAFPKSLIELNKTFQAFGLSEECEVQVKDLRIEPRQELRHWSKNDAIELMVKGAPGPFAWTLLPPLFANPERDVLNGGLRLYPDSIGGYRIRAQRSPQDGICLAAEYRFIMTHNPRLLDSVEPWRGPARETFQHLREVDALSLPAQGQGITVAILDTGVHYNHPALNQNIARNRAEVLNGMDDDRNGFIDDLYGWDFVYNDNSPYDDEGHGSAQAGFASSPIMGVAPQSRILPVKVANAFGYTDTATVAAGIHYAVDQKARILNLSLDMTAQALKNSQLLKNAFEYAALKGVLVVVAAGNGKPNGEDLDRKSFPHLDAPNVILVGARRENEMSVYSNFGARTVHTAVPGGEPGHLFASAFRENVQHRLITASAGTSVATSLLSGSAALVASQLATPQLISLIEQAGAPAQSLQNKTHLGRAFTARALVELAQRSTK